jgi:hypothetical protein
MSLFISGSAMAFFDIFLHSSAPFCIRAAEKVAIARLKYVKFRNRPKSVSPQPLALFHADVMFEF